MLRYERISAAEGSDSHWMIVLHGLGDSMEGYRWLPSALNLPWMGYALVDAPDNYFGGYSWYDFQENPHSGIVRSRKLLFELLDGFCATGSSSERIYLFGFSQGCLMTWEVGVRYPRPLAGCIGVSGCVHRAESLLAEASPIAGEQRFFITHGCFDPLIPIGPVRVDVQKLMHKGISIEWREFQKEHTIAGEEEIEAIRRFVLRCRRTSEPDVAD